MIQRAKFDNNRAWKTWSNFLFVLVGIYISIHFTPYGLLFAAMGLASGYSHWKNDFYPDWVGMYATYFARIGLFAHLAIENLWWSDFVVFLSVVAIVFALFFHDKTYKGENAKLAIGKKLGIRGLKWAYIIVLGAYLLSFGISFFLAPWWICLASGAVYLASLYIRDAWDHGTWHLGIALAELIIIIPIINNYVNI